MRLTNSTALLSVKDVFEHLARIFSFGMPSWHSLTFSFGRRTCNIYLLVLGRANVCFKEHASMYRPLASDKYLKPSEA